MPGTYYATVPHATECIFLEILRSGAPYDARIVREVFHGACVSRSLIRGNSLRFHAGPSLRRAMKFLKRLRTHS